MSKLLLEHEAEDLARSLLSLNDTDFVEDLIFDEYGIEFENFRRLASDLLLKTTPYMRKNEDHFCFVERYDNNTVIALARIIVKKAGEQ